MFALVCIGLALFMHVVYLHIKTFTNDNALCDSNRFVRTFVVVRESIHVCSFVTNTFRFSQFHVDLKCKFNEGMR